MSQHRGRFDQRFLNALVDAIRPSKSFPPFHFFSTLAKKSRSGRQDGSRG